MSLKDYTFDGSRKLELEKLPTNSKKDKVDKEEIIAKTKENLAKMQQWTLPGRTAPSSM